MDRGNGSGRFGPPATPQRSRAVPPTPEQPVKTVNEIVVGAPADRCFQAAADVERWPEILPHYRRVRFSRKDGFGRGRVEMAAYRHFGPLPYPVWWESEMEADPDEPVVRYHHVDGITEGMDVWWRFHPVDGEARTRIEIIHEWEGPGWPVIGRFAARRVIGPHFVMVVADRTLAGIRRAVDRGPDAGPASGDAGSGPSGSGAP